MKNESNVRNDELTIGGGLFFPIFPTFARPLADSSPLSRPPVGFVGAGVTGTATTSSS